MKKKYIKPQSINLTAMLGVDILEGETIGGQSHNPVDSKTDPDDVDFSAKKFDGNLWSDEYDD